MAPNQTEAPTPVRMPTESRTGNQSQVNSTLTIQRIEIPQEIKAAISARIDAELMRRSLK